MNKISIKKMKLFKNDNLTSSQMISGSWYQRPGGAGCTKQMHLVKWVSEHVPDVHEYSKCKYCRLKTMARTNRYMPILFFMFIYKVREYQRGWHAN